MGRKRGYFNRKKTSPIKCSVNNPSYTVKYKYTPVYNRDKKVVKHSSPPVKRPTKRYTDKELQRLVKPTKYNPLSIPGADGSEGNACILRPIKTSEAPRPRAPTNITYDQEVGNIITEQSLLEDLFNESIAAHKERGDCEDIKFHITEMKPWGVFFSAVLVCKNCNFKSDRKRLYEEVANKGKPGRKAASGNMRLQLSLLDTPIHNVETQCLIAGLGLRPGSLNGMQSLGYRAATITEKLGEADLERQQQYIINLLKERGVEQPDQVGALIAAALDTRYHGVFKASASTPGTGATQATSSLVECVSGDGLILEVDHVNKVCLKGSRLKAKGNTVICGPNANHANCTATQPREQGIQERHAAKRITKKMFDTSKCVISHLVTDSDGKASLGVEEGNKEILDKIEEKKKNTKNANQKNKSTKNTPKQDTKPIIPDLTWYKDPIHVGWCMSRHINGHKFNDSAFGVKDDGTTFSYKERLEFRKWIAKDIPTRVSLTVDNMRTHYGGDTVAMKDNADVIRDYLIKCYNGDHTSCRRAPLAQLTGCHGSGRTTCWLKKSVNLTAPGITSLSFDSNTDDANFIKEVIGMKLSYETMDFFSRGLTTSKCESANRGFAKSTPNNRNYFIQSKARTLSAAGRLNNTQLKFSKMKFEAGGCSLREGSGSLKALEAYQRKTVAIAAAKKTPEAIARKHSLRNIRRKEHAKERLCATNKTDYRKYQLDTATMAYQEATAPQDGAEKNMVKAQKVMNKHERRKQSRKAAAKKKQQLAMKQRNKEKRAASKTTPRELRDHNYKRKL